MQKSDFTKFANSKGISSMLLNSYQQYIEPYIIEERNHPITSLSIFSRLMMDRILFLGSEIDSDVSNIISAQLLWLENQGDSDITIQISSPGGNIYDGYKIVDCINFVKCDVLCGQAWCRRGWEAWADSPCCHTRPSPTPRDPLPSEKSLRPGLPKMPPPRFSAFTHQGAPGADGREQREGGFGMDLRTLQVHGRGDLRNLKEERAVDPGRGVLARHLYQ